MAYKTATATNPGGETISWWGALLLGAVFIITGLFVLGNLALATAINSLICGATLARIFPKAVDGITLHHSRRDALR